MDLATIFHVFQGKYAEAEPLYERCQAMLEKVLGPGHPDVARTLNGRAELFEKQVRAAIVLRWFIDGWVVYFVVSTRADMWAIWSSAVWCTVLLEVCIRFVLCPVL